MCTGHKTNIIDVGSVVGTAETITTIAVPPTSYLSLFIEEVAVRPSGIGTAESASGFKAPLEKVAVWPPGIGTTESASRVKTFLEEVAV